MFSAYPLTDLMAKDFPPVEWVVQHLIPMASTVVLSGSSGSYKSFVAMHISAMVCSGGKVFGEFPVAKMGILYIDEENGERRLKERFSMMAFIQDAGFFYSSLRQVNIKEKQIGEIINFAKERSIGLIVLDSLVRLHGEQENDATAMSKVFSLLKKINSENISVLVLHHHRKNRGDITDISQEIRGSSDIHAALDHHIGIRRKNNTIQVINSKARDEAELGPFRVELLFEDDSVRFKYMGKMEQSFISKKEKVHEAIIDILKLNPHGLKKNEIYSQLDNVAAKSTCRSALDELEENDVIEVTRGYGNALICVLKN